MEWNGMESFSCRQSHCTSVRPPSRILTPGRRHSHPVPPRQITEYLAESNPDARTSPAVLTNALWKLQEHLVTEFQGCRLPLLPDTTLDDLQTCLAATIAHAPTLARILALEDTKQHGKDTGTTNTITTTTTHRVLAATLAATALQANCPCVTKAFAAIDIIGLTIQNSLLRPSCSTIHAKALAMTRIACSDECLLSRENEAGDAAGDAVEPPPALWENVVNAGGDRGRCVDTMVSVILDVCADDHEDRLPLKRGQSQATSEATSEATSNTYLLAGFCIAMCGMLFDLAYQPHEPHESSDSDDVVFQASGSGTRPPTRTSPRTSAALAKNPEESNRRDETVGEIRAALEEHAAWNRLVQSKVLETARAIQRQPLGGDVPDKMDIFSNDLVDLGAGPLMALLQSQLGGMSLQRL